MDKKIENFGRRIGKLDDLPQELRKQLQSRNKDEIELKLFDIINDLEGIATLDEVLVGYYRKYSDVLKKSFLTNRLYRMIKNGVIVSDKKGIYKIKE